MAEQPESTELAVPATESPEEETSDTLAESTSTDLEREDQVIPPDIEEGLKATLDKIGDAIKYGFPDAIKAYLSTFNEGLKRAEVATNSTFTLTPEAQAYIDNRVRESIKENLQSGLSNTVESDSYPLSLGIKVDSEKTKERIKEIVKLGNEMEIEIAYVPKVQENESESTEISLGLNSSEEILAHYDDLYQAGLLKGLGYQLNEIGSLLRAGIIPGNDPNSLLREINRIVAELAKRGFTLTSEPVEATDTKLTGTELNSQRINQSLIRQIIKQEVVSNLTIGVQAMVNGAESSLKSGLLFEPIPSPEQIAAFESLGEKFKLIDPNAEALIQGQKFNLTHLSNELERVVGLNLSIAIEKILKDYQEYVKKGDTTMIAATEKKLERCLELATQFNVPINEPSIREKMSNQANPESLQLGINTLLEKAQSTTREGNFNYSQVLVSELERLRGVVEAHGLTDQVDFSQLEAYFRDHGIARKALKG